MAYERSKVWVEIVHLDGQNIIDKESVAEKLTPKSTEFVWCEGPAYSHQTGCLYFSDVAKSVMYCWNSEKKTCQPFREPSYNSNGNCIDRRRGLVTCEHYNRRVVRTKGIPAEGSEVEVVAGLFEGNPLNSPNDVIAKSDGSIWFTDPDYGCSVAEGHASPPLQKGCNVYRVTPDLKNISVVATDALRPNGLCFSPDESKLYVVDTGAVCFPDHDKLCEPAIDWNKPHNVRVYDVKNKNDLENGKVFIDTFGRSVPDGIRCDAKGNLYVGTWEGVQVFNSTGVLLCKINTPKKAANCCFGGKGNKMLFITATDAVWAIPCKIPGAV